MVHWKYVDYVLDHLFVVK